METTRRDFIRLAGVGAGLGAGAALLPGTAQAAPAAAPPVTSSPTGVPAAGRAAGHFPYRVGQWLPSDQRHLDAWLTGQIRAAAANPQPLAPVVAQLRELIESDPEVYMYFRQMFAQLPDRPKFRRTPIGTPQVRSYQHMCQLINSVLTTAPEFNDTGLVGFPINAILDWPMGTQAGFSAFLDDKVNAAFKAILDQWGQFLSSPQSRYVLSRTPRGWFGRAARKAMPDFDTTFNCDPAALYHGFNSWDDFFTRTFRPGRRPVAAPGNDAVIVNACESAPYRLARGVKWSDKFWIKAQPYSVRHMLASDPLAGQFVGGTIYQAFLSALSYHRWHSPVSGRIVKAYRVPGSYYSETLAEGWDPAGPNESQGYITEVAARGLIFIEADNPAIGLMCFVAVGMAEVSTCDITVSVGQHVTKGDQLGMFHFGGSTHCLMFRPGVKLDFDLHGQTPGLESSNIEVNSRIATVR